MLKRCIFSFIYFNEKIESQSYGNLLKSFWDTFSLNKHIVFNTEANTNKNEDNITVRHLQLTTNKRNQLSQYVRNWMNGCMKLTCRTAKMFFFLRSQSKHILSFILILILKNFVNFVLRKAFSKKQNRNISIETLQYMVPGYKRCQCVSYRIKIFIYKL